MMTRKDYVKTAKILKDYWENTDLYSDDFRYMVLDFADMFADDNPNFNHDKFMEAIYGTN